MKKNHNLILAALFASVFMLPYFLSTNNEQVKPVEAIEKWTEKTDLNRYSVLFAAQAKNDPTLDSIQSESGRYSFGWRHGSVENNQLLKFDKFAGDGNASANMYSYSPNTTTKDATVAEVVNWVFYTNKNDGVILFFTVNEECNFYMNATEVGGYPAGATSTYYIKEKDSDTYDEIQSKVHSSEKPTYHEALTLGKTHLNSGDTIVWEFKYQDDRSSRINLQKPWPQVVFEEVVEVQSEDITSSSFVSSLSGKNDYVESRNQLIKYGTRAGSIKDSDFASLTLNDLGSDDKNYHLTSNSLTLKNDQSYTFEYIALEDTLLDFTFDDLSDDLYLLNNVAMTGYKYISSKGKTQIIYSASFENKFDASIPTGKALLNANDKLFIEYKVGSESVNQIPFLPNINVSQPFDNESYLDFPKYTANSYVEETALDYQTIFFETARTKGAEIETKEYTIQVLTGVISKQVKYDFYHYNDGKYIDGDDESQTGAIYAYEDHFGANGGAALEKNRIAFSKDKNVIFAITPKVNTHISIHHPATDTGWINGASIYVYGYQKVKNKNVKINEINIDNKVQEADAFAMEFDLKVGDVGYYIFGAVYANTAYYNITPSFTSDNSLYNEEARNSAVLDFESNSYYLHDFVTDTVSNNFATNNYGLLDVSLCHGSVDQMEEFNIKGGDGSGTPEDTVQNAAENKHMAKFWRWQMRCGQDDDAIVKITATRNAHIDLTWRKEGEISTWATHTGLRYYCLDTDGLKILIETKFIDDSGHYELENTDYDFSIDLLAGQSFVVDYTSFGASNGVINYDFRIDATTAEYNEENLVDFTEVRALHNHIIEKDDALYTYVSDLNPDDYSLINWSIISDVYGRFEEEASALNTIEEIDAYYASALKTIQEVKTKVQEAESLAACIATSKQEAKDYLESARNKLSKANIQKAESLYDDFCKTISTLKSETMVGIQLTRFKATIDKMVEEGPDKNYVIYFIIGGASLAVVAAGIVTFVVIRKKRKNK